VFSKDYRISFVYRFTTSDYPFGIFKLFKILVIKKPYITEYIRFL